MTLSSVYIDLFIRGQESGGNVWIPLEWWTRCYKWGNI